MDVDDEDDVVEVPVLVTVNEVVVDDSVREVAVIVDEHTPHITGQTVRVYSPRAPTSKQSGCKTRAPHTDGSASP